MREALVFIISSECFLESQGQTPSIFEWMKRMLFHRVSGPL